MSYLLTHLKSGWQVDQVREGAAALRELIIYHHCDHTVVLMGCGSALWRRRTVWW